MPEPQPGTDRPADGGTPVTDRDPGVDEPTRSPVPPPGDERDGDATDGVTPEAATSMDARGTSLPDDGDHEQDAPHERDTDDQGGANVQGGADGAHDEPAADVPTDVLPGDRPAGEAPVTPARGSARVRPTGSAAVPARPTGSAAEPGQPADATPVPGRPEPTRVDRQPDPTRVETRAAAPAPRWSGSAPVPPPPPRKRAWGESAEPTPVPPPDSPEHLVPVDPWEGADTTGWDLHSVGLPALPPTLPYPTPQHTLPYPPPVSPAPIPPPRPAARPVPPAPPVARPVPAAPPVARPVPAAPPMVTRPMPPPALAPAPAPKQRRSRPAPAVTAPPGWRPPKGYVAVPVRRRRRWPWVLLLTVACCCGVPLWWVQPLSSQYPASASLPDQVRGLRLRDDESSQATAEKLKTEVGQAHLLAEDTFAGVYATSDGKRVTLFGGTGFRLTPESDADAEIARLTDEYALGDAVPMETGVRGRYERCAVGRMDGDAVVVCTSVDHGSLTTGVFTRLSIDDSARLLDELRTEVVTPKQS